MKMKTSWRKNMLMGALFSAVAFVFCPNVLLCGLEVFSQLLLPEVQRQRGDANLYVRQSE